MAKRHIFQYLVVLSVLFVLLVPQAGFAQGEPPFQPSETKLVFAGRVGDTIQRTFELVLQGDPVSDLELTVTDLKDVDGVVGVLASDIGVDPQLIDVLDATRQVVVTVNGTQKAGEFTGSLNIRMAGKIVNTVELVADIRAVPMVDTTENSKNIVLTITSEGSPFGISRVDPNMKVLSSTVVSLLQGADTVAEITGADTLALRRADGVTLPDQAVSIANTMPVLLAGQGGANLTLEARGENLKAGEYSGLLLVQVRDQASAVEVPVTVRVKDNFWLALLVLMVGPIIGAVIKFRSGDGQILAAAVSRIEKIRTAIRPDGTSHIYLAGDQRTAIDKSVRTAMNLIQSGAKAEEIEAAVSAAESMLAEYQEASNLWMAKLEQTEQEAAEMAKSDAQCGAWVIQLSEIRKNMENGKMQTLDAADTQLEAVKAAIEEYKKPKVEVFVETSLSVKDIGDILIGENGLFSSWGLYRLRLNLTNIIAFLLAYAISLVVGWLTIYVGRPTFGSDPLDYLTIFLWSATSTTIGSQTFDLKSIYTQVQAEVQELPSAPVS